MSNEKPMLELSPSPHIHSGITTSRIMLYVVLSLVPAAVMSVYVFGWSALGQYVVCILSCLFFESVFNKLTGRDNSIKDLSSVVTGVLLAMNIPVSMPVWGGITGAFVSIVIAKMVFGGLGSNPFNPALVGRVFLTVSFPSQMTHWIMPDGSSGATVLGAVKSYISGAASRTVSVADNVANVSVAAENANSYINTAAVTPLDGFDVPGFMQTFIGITGGSLGETSAAALLIGGLFLIAAGIISWHIPVIYIGTVFILINIYLFFNPGGTLPALTHLTSGGLVLGAVYMATDYSSSPSSAKGKVIFAAGCGILTVLIRLFGSFPEGVAFSILIMNSLVPLMDRYIKPRAYGEVGYEK